MGWAGFLNVGFIVLFECECEVHSISSGSEINASSNDLSKIISCSFCELIDGFCLFVGGIKP